MNDQSGYVLAYRSAWSKDIFKDFLEAAIWNFLFQNAFWKPGTKLINGTVITLERGQIAITPRFIAKGFRISERGARNVIQKLEKAQMLTIKTTNKASIITICNYDEYQLSEKTNGNQTVKQTENKRETKGANKNEINKRIKELNIPPTPLIDVPNFIDAELWEQWIKHRKEIKHGLKPTQAEAQIKKLSQWKDQGHDPNEIIRTSIANGWQGLFEPKNSTDNRPGTAEYNKRMLQKWVDE